MAQAALIDGNLINDDRPLAVEAQANSGVDIGDMTVNNAAGAAAVNIQDGGNTITVDGTVTMQGIVGATPTTPRIDPATSALMTITYPHHEIHAGDSFVLFVEDVDIDAAEVLIIAFTTADATRWLHAVVVAANSAACRFEILEGPTITDDTGTDLVPYNRNRNSATVSTVRSIKAVAVANQATRNPTITGDGTVIWSETMGGYKNASGSAGSATRQEWIFDQGVTYAFRITAIANDGVASIAVNWYEHINVV